MLCCRILLNLYAVIIRYVVFGAGPISYQLNLTSIHYIYDVFIDGVRYDLNNWNVWNLKGSISVDYVPSVIGVYFHSTAVRYGLIASDSAALVTGSSWKCTEAIYNDWMLTEFNDSSWPNAKVFSRNGDISSAINVYYHGSKPLDGISNDAYWIGAADRTTRHFFYCRSHPSAGKYVFT